MTKSKRSRSTASAERSASKTQRTATVARSREENLIEIVASLLWFWGSNRFGQLGFGEDVVERTKPTPSDIQEEILDVATGGMHTIVLMTDGSIHSFGMNDEGALGRPTTEAGAAEGDPTLPGRAYLPRKAKKPINVVCTNNASFVLTEDGSIYGCGTFRNARGVLGFSPTVEIATRFQQVYKPRYRASPVAKMSAGGNHMIAVLKDGDALSWGDGDQGQLGRIFLRRSLRGSNPKNNMLTPARIPGFCGSHFVDAYCGESTTILKGVFGQFYGCGLNSSCQLALPLAEGVTNENIEDLEERVNKRLTILKPTSLLALAPRKIVSVACGKDHSIGVSKRGRVFSWGAPKRGVMGREDLIPFVNGSIVFEEPKRVTGIKARVTSISCGQAISGCIDEEGDVYTWGAAMNEMLGTSEEDDVMIPRKIPRNQSMTDNKFKKLSFGGQHVALLGHCQAQSSSEDI